MPKAGDKAHRYLMELEEGRIECDGAKLISQKAVDLALAAKAGKIIPTFVSPKHLLNRVGSCPDSRNAQWRARPR
jgi:hypothetical protein